MIDREERIDDGPTNELQRLRAWKEEAMVVLSDIHAARAECDPKLGETGQDQIRRLYAEREEALAVMRDEGKDRAPSDSNLVKFARAMAEECLEGYGIEGCAFFDALTERGILVPIPDGYDPEKHGEQDCEPGEDSYVIAEGLGEEAPPAPTAEVVEVLRQIVFEGLYRGRSLIPSDKLRDRLLEARALLARLDPKGGE